MRALKAEFNGLADNGLDFDLARVGSQPDPEKTVDVMNADRIDVGLPACRADELG